MGGWQLRSELNYAGVAGAKLAMVALVIAGFSLTSCGPPAAPRASTSPADAATSRATSVASFCSELNVAAIEAVLAQSAAELAESSSNAICAMRVGDGSDAHDLQLRHEDAFANLEAVEAAIDGGDRVAVGANMGYWAPTLQVLWVQAGERLYAVQLIGSALDEPEARELARRLAEVGLPN